MSMPLIIRSYNQDQYVWMLQSAYAGGWRVPDPEYATSSDADIYEKLRRDPDIHAAMNTRLHAVASRHWTIELPNKPKEGEKRLGGILEDGLREIEKFTSSRYNLAQAVIRGTSWGYVSWRRKWCQLGDETVPPAMWLVPCFIKDVDRRRFRYGIRRYYDESTRQEVVDVPLEMRSIERGQWERVRDDAPLITMTYQDEEGRLGVGRGLIEGLFFYHFLKGRLLEEGMQGVERIGQGMLVLSIDGLRDSDYGNGNNVVQTAVLNALKKFRSRHVLVKDKADDLELKETTGSGGDLIMNFLHELNRAMRVLLLGADMAFGGSREGGSTEMAESQIGVSEALIQFDRELLDEAVTKYIVRRFVWYNRKALAELGLYGQRIPRFASIQEQREDPEKAATTFATLKQAGLRMRTDEVYKKVGYSVPGPEDDVIEGDEPPTMDSLFGGGGGFPGDEDGGDEGGGDEEGAGAVKPKKPKMPPGKALMNNVRRALFFNAMGAPQPAPAPVPAPAAVLPPINLSITMPENPSLKRHKEEKAVLLKHVVDLQARLEEALNRPVHVEVHPPVVNVAAPNVKVDVAPPEVNIDVEAAAAPNVVVEATQVDVHVPAQAAPVVNITPPSLKKTMEFVRDEKGHITGAEVK